MKERYVQGTLLFLVPLHMEACTCIAHIFACSFSGPRLVFLNWFSAARLIVMYVMVGSMPKSKLENKAERNSTPSLN